MTALMHSAAGALWMFALAIPAAGQEPASAPKGEKAPAPRFLDFAGHAEAVVRVEIRARATGYLTKIAFKEGSVVQKGDLLFEIDDRPYAALADQAKAHVKEVEAVLRLRTANREGARALLANRTIGQNEFTQTEAAFEEAAARVAAAKAAAALAELNLSFTKITAPISGNIGRSSIDAGNLVTADATLLASLVSSDPIYIYFNVDEGTYSRLIRQRKADDGNARPAMGLTVQIGLAQQEGLPIQGKVDFIDVGADPKTGTILFRATVPNPKGSILPGMFARVRLPLEEAK